MLKKDNVKKVISSIEYKGGSLVSFTEKDGYEYFEVKIDLFLFSYSVNITSGDVVFGSKDKKVEMSYLVTVKRKIRENLNVCPNCNSNNNSLYCANCNCLMKDFSDDCVVDKVKNIGR